MRRQENITAAHQGNGRFLVAIPKLIAALKAPLRAAELEAMRPGPAIGPIYRATAAPDDCLTGLAMRAPLLCSMFRHLAPRNPRMSRAPIFPSSAVSAARVHRAKSSNLPPTGNLASGR